MTRILPLILVLGFMIFCLVDCAQTPADEAKGIPKALWLVVIVVVPLVGGVLWLVAAHLSDPGNGGGRGGGGGRGSFGGPGGRGSGRPARAPDDDEDFLRGLNKN